MLFLVLHLPPTKNYIQHITEKRFLSQIFVAIFQNPLVNAKFFLLILDRSYDYYQLSMAIMGALAIIKGVLSSLRQFWQPKAF